jgi:hypothetical protein
MSADNVPIFNVGTLPRIVPVVLPSSATLSLSGKVTNVPVYGSVDTSGWLVWDHENKEWLVSPTKRGYRHLRDYYDEEGNLEGWAMYQRYIKDWQGGRTQQSFPFDLLPKKVRDMQQGLTGVANPDPWLVQKPKPTTGALADIKPDPKMTDPHAASPAPKGSK